MFCGSVEFRKLSRSDRFGLPFGTQICKSCGLITQNRQIAPDSMSLFYDVVYWPLIRGVNNDSASLSDTYVTNPKVGEEASFVLQFVDERIRNIKIFEVGCGAGIRITKLKNELSRLEISVDAYGCDYSADALAIACEAGISTIKGGFKELSEYGKADILILSHLFEHLPDLDRALQEIDT